MAALLKGNTCHKVTDGWLGVELYSFFNHGARWGGWSMPHPDRFNPEMTRDLYTGGRVDPRAGLGVAENLASAEIRFPDRPARSQSL
jgi:hypothetical protein